MNIKSAYLILLQTVFVLSWSSGFIGARLGSPQGGAINLLFWRFLLVTACLLPWVWSQVKTVSWASLRYNSIIGLLSQFAYLVSVYIAIQHGLPAGTASIICALQPLITAALTQGDRHERSAPQEWLGLSIGFVGVGVVIAGDYTLTSHPVNIGLYLLPLISATTMSIATLYQRRQSVLTRNQRKNELLLPLYLQSSASLALLTIIGLSLGSIHRPTSLQIWVSIVWLTIFSTFIAYLSLWSLLRYKSATHVASLVYLEPPVTLIWAAWMFGDATRWTTWLGIAVIAAGLYACRRPTGIRSGNDPARQS